jgi:NADH-quinone oxidoreductase subunit K
VSGGLALAGAPVAAIPMAAGLVVAVVLFALGLLGVLLRRNLVLVLASIEIMLNAAGVAFVVAGARWHQPDGQVMFFFILAMAAAEVSVGLALAILFRRVFKSLNVDDASKLKG